MSDGEVRVTLDDQTARRLEDAARAAGRPVERFVADLIADRLDEDRFSEAHAAFEVYDRDGLGRGAKDAMAEFVRRVASRTSQARTAGD